MHELPAILIHLHLWCLYCNIALLDFTSITYDDVWPQKLTRSHKRTSKSTLHSITIHRLV